MQLHNHVDGCLGKEGFQPFDGEVWNLAIATRARGVMMHVSRGIEIFGWLKSLHESRNA